MEAHNEMRGGGGEERSAVKDIEVTKTRDVEDTASVGAKGRKGWAREEVMAARGPYLVGKGGVIAPIWNTIIVLNFLLVLHCFP